MIERHRQPLDSGPVLGLADLRHVITEAGQAIWSHCRSFLCRRPAINRVLHLSTSAGTAGNGRSTSGLSAIRAVTVVAKLIWCKRDRVSDLTANAVIPCHPSNLRFPHTFFGLLLSPPGGPILQQASHEALPFAQQCLGVCWPSQLKETTMDENSRTQLEATCSDAPMCRTSI